MNRLFWRFAALVLLSLIDITARKKAEAYLEYLGKHDALTKLRNRAFYVDELNRISRKGPWPLTVMALCETNWRASARVEPKPMR